MNAISLVDMRLQLARALDGLASPGSDLRQPGWPWRWPEHGAAVVTSIEPSAFVREWIEAGQGQPPAQRRTVSQWFRAAVGERSHGP